MVPPLKRSAADERQINFHGEAVALSPCPDLEGEVGRCVVPISERTSATDLPSYSLYFFHPTQQYYLYLTGSIYVAIPQSLAPFITWHLDASKSLKLLSFQLIPPETQLTILKERTEAQKNGVGLISPNIRSLKCRCLHRS